MSTHGSYIASSLEILTLLTDGFKSRGLLDYAASVEFARNTIIEHQVNDLYDKAEKLSELDQLAM